MSKKVRIGINGLGRIGRNTLRMIVSQFNKDLLVVAANDLAPVEQVVESLKKDSVYGKFPVPVTMPGPETEKDGQTQQQSSFEIAGERVHYFSEKNAENIPWGSLDVDVVLECTSYYTSTKASMAHIRAGAKKVIISAPCKDETKTIVLGVNHESLSKNDQIISNASCTTNCYGVLTKALELKYSIVAGIMSTTHATTATQSIVDSFGGSKSRGTLNNIIPWTTGAAVATTKVFPELQGKLNGTSLRVPVETGSVLEATYLISGDVNKDRLVADLEDSAKQINKSTVLGKTAYLGDFYECSRDSVGEPYSAMITTNAVIIPAEGNSLVKLSAYYDNEMGFCTRMAELAQVFGSI